MNLHDIRQAQANFNLAEITNQRKSLHKLPQVFVKEFNPRFLAQMEIDQFVAGKGGVNKLIETKQIWIISNPFFPENKNIQMEPVNYRIKINAKK